MVLKSLTQRSECVASESRSLRMFSEYLVYCSMRLGVPFIAPRQLGAVGDSIGRQFLPSIGWHTGQSGVLPDMNSSSPVPVLLPFLAKSTVGPSVPLAHRTLYSAHRTVRCDQPTVGAGHASPANRVADRWPRAPLAHRTVWCTLDSPVIFSRSTSFFFPRATSSPPGQPGHGQSGAPQAGAGLAELS
jgi:hypothetical protein